jgi:hypothetical protein
MTEVKHLEAEELEAGLDDILQSPKDHGVVKMIVRRPDVDHREMLGSLSQVSFGLETPPGSYREI